MGLAFRYIVFAIASTLANLLLQECVFHISPIMPLATSMAAGTGIGFVIKYVLDKYWIFQDESAGHTEEIKKIVLYGAFSVATTIVFWATEIIFWQVWQSPGAKYGGAIAGLTLGYTAKYFLDRALVFNGR